MPIHAVVLIKTAGVFQRFNDTCNRNFIDRINPVLHRTLHRGQHRRAACRIPAVGKVIRQAKTAARRTNLAEHRGKRH
ncbi:hypothetical protein D3C78_790660 [compost metagenome]